MAFIHPFEALENHLKTRPDAIAFGALKLGRETYETFRELSWKEVHEKVCQYAQVLQSKGLKKGDTLAIQSKNQAAWVILDWACFATGVISVPLYPQSIRSEVDYILNEAEVKLFISEEDYEGLACERISFEELEERSLQFSAKEFKPQLAQPEEVATIIYTSGTTGEPKGVVHNFNSICAAIHEGNTLARLTPQDRMISYLPLSHVVERVICDLGSLNFGMSLYFVDQVEKVAKMIPVVQPTVFAAVPRIWDLMLHKVERQLEGNSLAKFLFRFFPESFAYAILGRLVRKKLGFANARLLLSGAAKLNEKNAIRLQKLGMRITEGYGLTETFAITCFNDPDAPVLGSVGRAFPKVTLRIDEDGEIVLKAKHHFLGYFKKPDETKLVLKDGWFFTGDIGHLDAEGRLFITDRKKDIFKTTNGKYVAPQPIELEYKAHPAVQEAMVVGQNQPYCVAILSLTDGETSEDELLKLMDRINSQLPMHEKIHTIICTKRTWSVAAGELTPSMKLKRRQILQRYREGIEMAYTKREKIIFLKEESSEDAPVMIQKVTSHRAYSCL